MKPPRIKAIVGAAYLAMILFLWSPFAFSSGMDYETVFAYRSDTSPWLDPFIDYGDSPRLLLGVFYHFSYLIGLLLGIPGSFVPFQFVYAALWWARAMLVFLILRRLLGGYDFLCYLAGALVLVHASDSALQFVGQLHQPGFIFLMLLGIYFLVEALYLDDPAWAYVLTALACISEALSLWMYETGLFILVLAPPLILLGFRRVTSRFAVVCGAWYAAPFLYSYLALQRFLHSGPTPYETSVVRTDWRPFSMAGDLLFNVKTSLFFWLWAPIPGLDLSKTSMAALAGGAAVSFALGAVLLMNSHHSRVQQTVPDHTLGVLIAVGLAVVVASFPAYLILSGSRLLWRTQILSGIGFGITWAAIFALTGNVVMRVRESILLAQAFCLCLALTLLCAGAFRVVELGSWHRARWERHRKVMAQIVALAPQVRAGTLFVLFNVPSEPDPFMGNSMWFDVALRLAYPGTPVSGFYFHSDGVPAPGYTFKLNGIQWIREGRGFLPLLEKTNADDALILESTQHGMRILKAVPPVLCGTNCATDQYQPEAVIVGRMPSIRAVNRYGPLSQ